MKRTPRTPRRTTTSSLGLLGAIAALPVVLLSCTTLEGRANQQVAALPEPTPPTGVITEADLVDLPPLVRKYLEYSQVIGKPRITSFAFATTGRIRGGPDSAWMPLNARQFNHLAEPSRIYYIRGKWPMSGLDTYVEGEGRMQIKLLNLISIADVDGPEMAVSGLVSFMNDLLICPLGYFSLPVEWRQIDDRRAELTLSDRGLTATATITFDELGRVVNWESDDRFGEIDGEPVRDHWSTPMTGYGEVNGLRIPVTGEGVHDFGDGPYAYVELDGITNLEWNVAGLPVQ